jgi:hypothetical protein
MKLPGTKMKDLPPRELEAILQRLPELRAHFSEHSAATLEAHTADAKRFIHGEAGDGDDLAWKHKALHEAQLADARQALGRSQERTVGPPAKLDRERLTPRPGHEWLTREEGAGILEIREADLNRYAMQNGIGLRKGASGALEYNAADLLRHARDRGLIHKNAVKQSIARTANKARGRA